MIKSGEEWQWLSRVSIDIYPDGTKKIRCEIDSIDPVDNESKEMVRLVAKYDAICANKFNKVIGRSAVDLDSTEESVRYKATPSVDFIADCIDGALQVGHAYACAVIVWCCDCVRRL